MILFFHLTFLVLFILFFIFTRPAGADELEIKSVDIYPGKAKFTFAFISDSSDFKIEIPGAFQENSVKILNLLDTEGVNIFTSPREMWVPSSLQELKDKIDEHKHNISGLQAKQNALEQTNQLLEETQAPTQTDAKDIISYIQMAQDMKLKSENELNEIALGLAKENDSLKLLQSEFEKRMPYNSNSAVKITGHLKNGNVVVFEAFTRCVKWTPTYTLNLDTKTGKITARLYSKTSQRTGLDYTGEIFFHTKLPNEEVVNPEKINPFYVSLNVREEQKSYDYPLASRPLDEMRFCSSPSDSAPSEPDYDDYELKKLLSNFEDEEADEAPKRNLKAKKAKAPTLSEKAYDDLISRINKTTTFAPSASITLTDNAVKSEGKLTGDGIDTEFILGDIELTGKITLEVIPEQNIEAWIIVDIDDVSKPMIPGKATLRVDNHQTGSINIPEYGFGRDSIPFGYVSHITSKKTKKDDEDVKEDSSLFNVVKGGYTIQVTNDMQEAKTVIVRDRLPFSYNNKLKIDIKNITPAPKEQDFHNILTWELEINAGETADISVEYTISYPLNETISFN